MPTIDKPTARPAQRTKRDDPLGPWLLHAYLLVAALLVIVGVKLLPQSGGGKVVPIPGPAWTAAVGLGGIGVILGTICGWQRGSLRGCIFTVVLYGAAGVWAGFSVGGLMATLVSPVNHSLTAPPD